MSSVTFIHGEMGFEFDPAWYTPEDEPTQVMPTPPDGSGYTPPQYTNTPEGKEVPNTDIRGGVKSSWLLGIIVLAGTLYVMNK
jgi:hypothetical protein